MYKQCDLACPIHAEISYWMDRCNIYMDNPILNSDPRLISSAVRVLEDNKGSSVFVRSDNTVETADRLAYCAICLHGRGTGLSHGIYNLNFSLYVDEIKRSWQTRSESEDLEYMRIWSNSSTYLIVSHMDFVKFGDFESQTLLGLLQQRMSPSKTTLCVIPDKNKLVGSGPFFSQVNAMTILGDKNKKGAVRL